jgi:flagellar motor switch protein FliN
MSSSQNSSSSSELQVQVGLPPGPPPAPQPTVPDGIPPLYDVMCSVDVVLGTASMTVRECLNMRRHTVIRLNQSAGGDMQVVVNGVAIANGEVVIIDNSTALRVTDILPPPSSEVTG